MSDATITAICTGAVAIIGGITALIIAIRKRAKNNGQKQG